MTREQRRLRRVMIAELYRRGHSIRWIARRLRISKGTVSRSLDEHELERRPTGNPFPKQLRNARILQEKLSGSTYKAIGIRHGITHARVREIVMRELEKS